MKKTAAVIITILIGFSSMAQTSDSATSSNKEFRKMDRHPGGQNLEKLNLTDDQKAQMKTLNESFRQQMQDLDKNTRLSPEDITDKRQDLMKDHKEKMNAILTPGQISQMQNMRHEYGGLKKSDKRDDRFDDMTKDLNLTPDQSAKMKDLSDALKTNMQAIRQNTSLGQDEKRDQVKSLMKKHKEDMEALLTDQQKEQLKNNMKNRRRDSVRS